MKKSLNILAFAVPVALLIAPLSFEVAITFLFAANLFILVLHDYAHAAHMQHLADLRTAPKAKTWKEKLGLAA